MGCKSLSLALSRCLCAGQVLFDDDYFYYSGETELTSATA
jgi:hypothetical protein